MSIIDRQARKAWSKMTRAERAQFHRSLTAMYAPTDARRVIVVDTKDLEGMAQIDYFGHTVFRMPDRAAAALLAALSADAKRR